MNDRETLTAATSTAARGRRAITAVLVLLAAICALVGAYATLAPHSFYRHVVGVDMLGPYNQHLLTDVGGLYLGFAITFYLAAVTLSRELIRASCFGFAATQSLHSLYHVLHLSHFTVVRATEQTIGIGAFVALPLIALALNRHERFPAPPHSPQVR